MNETINSITNTEFTNINDTVRRVAAAIYDGAAQSDKHPIVFCGRCGVEEQYIGPLQTICPNCHE